MKKILAIALACIMIVSVFGACSSKETADANNTELEQKEPVVEPIEEPANGEPINTPDSENVDAQKPTENTGITVSAGKLIMACEPTFPPYEYMEGTEVVGVDVDIAQEIADELGLELVVETTSFDAVIPSVQTGKADFGASGISITEKRKEEVDFSIEYAVSKQVILTKEGSAIKTATDLNGKKAGVQLGTVADLVLTEENPEIELVRNKKYTDLTMELLNDRVDAIVLDALPAQAIQKQNEGLVVLEEAFFEDSYAIAVAKDNEEMLEAINKVLQRLADEGKIEEFTTKHLG